MPRDVSAIMRPRTVAVLGASATRRTQGNQVIGNLQRAGFKGRVIPVHATAETIDGLPAVNGIGRLEPGIDVAVVAIPASGVAAALSDLARAGVAASVVFTNGFSPEEASAVRAVCDTTAMAVHGPNCMGLIDVHEAMPLYPATITAKLRPGRVALVAQSGSAAISLMNSSSFGVSTVLTMGSEFQVTAPDYLRFFARDERTSVVGVVLESIQHPEEFEAAVAEIYSAGKSLAVLKVGRSAVGNLAVQAHTGALISRSDAYDRFFARCQVPVVNDYDELIATLECFDATHRRPAGGRIGIVGISGGETALACDLAADLGIKLAQFGSATRQSLAASLPGASGLNPLDLGATVNHTPEQDRAAIDAILRDPDVDMLMLVQDSQASLTPTMLNNYTPHILEYGQLTQRSAKPVVIVSPTAENTHPRIHEMMAGYGVPVLRGMRAGMVALRNLGLLGQARTGTSMRPRPAVNPAAATLRSEIAGLSGPLPAALARRVLEAYDIPLVRTALVRTAEEALQRAEAIGYPLVLKIDSPDIAHRSDVGGVALGIADSDTLREALDRMVKAVQAAAPDAAITGFELQEQLLDHAEAMVGFVAAPPFGAVMTIGTGGTMVELLADSQVELCPVTPERAREMLAETRLGAYLGGYRKLTLPTDTGPLARLAANLSRLAADLGDLITECDLNPVLVRRQSGEVRVVDALMSVTPS